MDGRKIGVGEKLKSIGEPASQCGGAGHHQLRSADRYRGSRRRIGAARGVSELCGPHRPIFFQYLTSHKYALTVKSKDEMLLPVAPLTTAVSSREYLASGTFIGSLIGPGEPRGILEVGYEIGCGIDMSTSNGVSLTGTAGITPSLGATVPLVRMPTITALPVVSTPIGGAITVGLKPGIVNVVPVDKKEFKGPDPWVMISGFHVKIDGCVGQSFIRSYATLTRQTDQSDVVLSYVGVTKAV
jgi:hypothetical protein